MLRRLRVLVLVAVLLGGLLPRVSFSDDAPRVLTTLLDGKPVAGIPAIERDRTTWLDVEAVARDLGVTAATTNASVAITDGHDVRYLTVGKEDLTRWDETAITHLDAAPIDAGSGAVYLAVADVEHVFRATAALADGAALELHSLSPRVAEAAAAASAPSPPARAQTASSPPPPPAPVVDSAGAAADASAEPPASDDGFSQHDRPIVRATPAPALAATGADGGDSAGGQPRHVGTVRVTLDQVGRSSRVDRVAYWMQGTVRGSVQMMRVDGTTTAANGAVEIGSPTRFLGIGQRPDPLAASVFASSATSGLSLVDKDRGLAFHDVVNQFGAHTYAVQRQHGNAVTSLFNVATPGRGGQTLVSERDATSIGETEIVASTKGFGIGLSQETRGRIFVRASESYASPGLPLTDGSAPLRAGLGWNVSPALTLLAGYGSAYNGHPSSYAGGSLRLHDVSGSFSVTPGSMTGMLSVNRPLYNAFLTITTPRGTQERFYNLSSTIRTRQGASLRLDASGAMQANQRDVALSLVPPPARPGFVAGVEYVRDLFVRKVGPVFGYSTPVGRGGLRIEFASHPTATGSAMRFAFAQDILLRPRTWRTNVHFVDASGPVELYVDGRAPQRVDGDVLAIRLERGTHALWARAASGGRASEAVMVSSSARELTMHLLPIAPVAGHVAYAGVRETAPTSLGGIIVKLLPCGQLTTTGPDGTFFFAPQAIAPGSRVVVDDASLPSGFALEVSAAPVLPDTEAVLKLRSSRNVETTKF